MPSVQVESSGIQEVSDASDSSHAFINRVSGATFTGKTPSPLSRENTESPITSEILMEQAPTTTSSDDVK